MVAPFSRYVAIGDSSTEGLDDPDGRGGYHGWANRLATRVASAQSSPLLYANLAIRGRSTRRIRDEQLGPAVAMRPDLVTLFTGTNDVAFLGNGGRGKQLVVVYDAPGKHRRRGRAGVDADVYDLG